MKKKVNKNAVNHQALLDSEKWLHRVKDKSKLDKALDWAEKHEPKDNFDVLIKKLEKCRK